MYKYKNNSGNSFSILSVLFLFLSVLNGLLLIDSEYGGTYGSDAYYYFSTAIDLLNGKEPRDILAPVFVYYQALVVYISPYHSHAFFVFINSFFYVFFSVLIRSAIINLYGNKKINYVGAFLFNGVIVWALFRGMKESLIFMSLALVFFSMVIHRTDHFYRMAYRNASIFFVLSIFVLIHAYIKPAGEYFAISVIVFAFVMMRIGFVTSVLFCFVLICIISTLLIYAQDFFLVEPLLAHQRLSALEQNIDVETVSIFTYLISPFRFVFGPGPFKSFLQLINGDLFVASTRFGDVLIFLGSLVWYFFILNIAIAFIKIHRLKIKLSYCLAECILFSYMLLYVVSYSISYFGTGDTRHRAILYFCSIPLFFKLINAISNAKKLK